MWVRFLKPSKRKRRAKKKKANKTPERHIKKQNDLKAIEIPRRKKHELKIDFRESDNRKRETRRESKRKEKPKFKKKQEIQENKTREPSQAFKRIHARIQRDLKQGLRPIVEQKEICKERKRIRDKIMKETKGRGMSIKNARWTEISKIRCK